MHVTLFSFIVSLVWVSFFAKIIPLLRKHMFLLRCFSIYPLIIILFISILRLFCFFELPFTRVIISKRILPTIQHILRYPLFSYADGKVVITLIHIFIVTWTFVALQSIIKKIQTYIHFQHLLHLLPSSKDTRIQSIMSRVQVVSRKTKPVKIIINEEVKSPAIIGFFSPIIILPDIDFSDNELFGIFAHEWAHYCHKHVFIKFIGEVIQSVFWWNPMFKQLNREIEYALEMHSDKKAIHILSRKQQYSYLEAIIKIVNSIQQSKKISPFSCSLLEENNLEQLNQRFEMILHNVYSTNKLRKLFFIVPMICIVFIASYSFVLQPYNLPNSTQIGTVTNIPEDAYLIKTDSGYLLMNANDEFIANIAYIDESLEELKIITQEQTP